MSSPAGQVPEPGDLPWKTGGPLPLVTLADVNRYLLFYQKKRKMAPSGSSKQITSKEIKNYFGWFMVTFIGNSVFCRGLADHPPGTITFNVHRLHFGRYF